MPEVLIQAENVGKKFCRDLKKSLWYGVKDSVCDLLQVSPEYRTDTLRDQEFWANSDITFQVQRGECLGLIGGNGAGKTTLLKMLSGLIKPDTGNITVKGRVGALIAIGAGFNPVLTGRENIMVYGSILGMSIQQTKDKLDQIIDFAEISDAIDSPVRTYSSGMNVRLGFSTAVNLLRPDILLLDEVLAVGDLGFRRKCYAAVDELLDNAAVIFVTHSMDHVRYLCNNVLFLDRGRGEPMSMLEGTKAYIASQRGSAQNKNHGKVFPPVISANVALKNREVNQRDNIELELELELESRIANPTLQITINNRDGDAVACWSSQQAGVNFDCEAGRRTLLVSAGPCHLSAGEYSIAVNAMKPQSTKFYISQLDAGTLHAKTNQPELERGMSLLPTIHVSVDGAQIT